MRLRYSSSVASGGGWRRISACRGCYNPLTSRKVFPMTEPSTPLMRQYAAIKKQHPTALLFF
ncbi:MAG TPA: hypothetical protein VIJ01_09950, partial [Candidatus Angelobacter sp.]